MQKLSHNIFLLNFREKIEGIMRKYLPSDQFAEIEISSHGLLYCVMNSAKKQIGIYNSSIKRKS